MSRGEPRPRPCSEVREDSLTSALLHPDTATPGPPPPQAQGAPTPALGSPRALGAAFLPSRSLCRTLSPPLARSKAGKWLQQILVQLQQREQRYSRAGSGTSDSIRGMLGGLAAAFTELVAKPSYPNSLSIARDAQDAWPGLSCWCLFRTSLSPHLTEHSSVVGSAGGREQMRLLFSR